jgi:hypothetical protein
MAFIGNTNTTQAFTPAVDFFSGTGSATAFTLSRPVASVAQVQVTIDNVAQNPSSAYTVSNNTITFTSAPLSGTNNIYVYYTSPITQVIAPGQGTVNTTALGNITNIASGNSSLTLQTGSSNTTAVTVDTSQNVLVGLTSAISSFSKTIQIQDSSSAAICTSITGANARNWFTGCNSNGLYSVYDSTAGAYRLNIDSSGNVGIGTSSPSYKLHVVSSSASTPLLIDGGTNTYFGIKNSSQTAYLGAVGTVMYFENNGSERMRIDSNGVVLVGQTSTFSQGSPIFVAGSSSSNQPIGHRGYGGVDGTYVDWLISAPYQGNTTEQNRIKSSISSNGANSGLVFMISDGAGLSTQTQSFRINRTSCTVIGSLSKGSGSFKIDHPLTAKKDTHHLVHSFIEGPQADLIYRGKVSLVDGAAIINIDTASSMTEGTFVALCRDVQCFTTNESDWTPVRGSVTGNILTIEAQDNTSTASISWMVIGERQDKHMYETDWTDETGKVIVEPLKETLENR